MALPLIIIGAGGFGREVAWLVADINADRTQYELLGFLDDQATGTVEGYPVLGSIDSWLEKPPTGVLVSCAIGDPAVRARTVRRVESAGLNFASLIHPTVRMSKWVNVAPGSIICAGSILTTNIRVQEHSIINIDCTVGHDSVLGRFASLMPGTHISGEVILEDGVYMGTGSVVINRIRIGAWTIVGAGAVVTSDLPDRVVAVGVPAKPIKIRLGVPEL